MAHLGLRGLELRVSDLGFGVLWGFRLRAWDSNL